MQIPILNDILCLTGIIKTAMLITVIYMEIRVLEYFLAVAREQSISGAAKYLHLTQPTLSRQLKELEEELGKQLFERGKRKITLTDDGVLLRKRAEEIIDLVQKTEAEIGSSDEYISGDIYIGAGETEGIRSLVSAANKMKSKHPDVRLNIESGDAVDVLYKLDKGLIDFGLILGDFDKTKYDFMKLPAEDTWGLLVKANSDIAEKEYITPDDLLNKPIILSRQVFRNNELSDWFGPKIKKMNFVATCNLIFNGSVMVDEGMGFALTLDRLITNYEKFRFIPLKPELKISMHLVWKKYQIFSKAAAAFLNEVKENING